ncbi:TVP38/TMEM64 family protein [Synergistales bacterium]|nr:TVP38/TMEM64 family protein [Synergistales bacterium]
MTRSKYFKPACLLVLAAFICLLNRCFGWGETIASGGLDFLRTTVAENELKAAVFYVLVTVASCVVLALPGVTFALFAGVLFGPLLGTALCLFATTVGAAAAFLVGRYFLRDAVKPMLERSPRLKKLLFDDMKRSGMVLLAITRLLPVFPYNLQNFAYGVTDIGFWPYTIYTFVFLAPGVAVFTVGFDVLGKYFL